MYQRPVWYDVPLGRRIINRMGGGRAQLVPAIVPELVSWLRLHGNRYVALLTSVQSARRHPGDAFLNSVRQTTEFRINLIQDLINQTVDQFSHRDYLSAWADTCRELGIDDVDTNPELFVPGNYYQDGEGI